MAWADHDAGYLSVMADVLGPNPVTCSLSHQCLDRPAIANFLNRSFIVRTGLDTTVNVMSAVDDTNVVFGNHAFAPGRSRLGPAICTLDSAIYVAWIDADTNHVMLWKMGDAQATDLNETSLSAPALVGVANEQDNEEGPTIAWVGSDSLRQINMLLFNSGLKVTFPTIGPDGATSSSGPSLTSFESDGFLFWILGWPGLPGGSDGRNHLNIIYVQAPLGPAEDKRTVQQWSSTGPAILQAATDPADPTDPLVAWVDDSGQINLANFNKLPVITT